MPSSLLQVVNSLLQTCYNNWNKQCEYNLSRQLVNRFVTTCLQTCNNLCVFTRVYIQLQPSSESSDIETRQCVVAINSDDLCQRVGSIKNTRI